MQLPDSKQISPQVCALAGEVLGRSNVTGADNFFALDGQSVQAMMLLAQIELRWAVRITLTELFDHPVLSEIAELIERGSEHVP